MIRMPGRRAQYGWDADKVRSLREHLQLSQRELADEMGTRQQTISEWETGRYGPRGASSRLLSIIAERAGFEYGSAPPGAAGAEAQEDSSA